jgi:hypothetical protein
VCARCATCEVPWASCGWLLALVDMSQTKLMGADVTVAACLSSGLYLGQGVLQDLNLAHTCTSQVCARVCVRGAAFQEELARVCGLWLLLSSSDAAICEANAVSGKMHGHAMMDSQTLPGWRALVAPMCVRLCICHSIVSRY